ncbi:hypothetical protein AJ79_03809 [Helicocarpus griseus UAMH5409]|uniref:CFEM domain-containing protein n=1 Tax=Helicocarpus griseus UAMH5409 TaxID=1447875 RepID=A0A2B7XW67_9EURO|nr:hypothetical protein AJ79_03809 [Helicocarpus griseus UAMH5409]
MKSIIALAGLFLTVTAVCQDLAPILSLPECPKSCVFGTIVKAPNYGCTPTDVSCLCKSKDYQNELLKCSGKCTPEEAEKLAQAGTKLCGDAGAPIPPVGAADITIPIPTFLPSLPIPSIPIPSLPSLPIPSLPIPSIPLPSIPSLPIPSIPLPSIPQLPDIPLPSIPQLPDLPLPSFATDQESPSSPQGQITPAPTTTSNSLSILPVEPTDGTTYLDPLITPSNAPTTSPEMFLGAANIMAPIHAGAVLVGILAIAL